MALTAAVLLLHALALFTASSDAAFFNPIRLTSPSNADSNGPSWRFAIETNNKQAWRVVPTEFKFYVAEYIEGDQYIRDANEVLDSALSHANSLSINGDGKDIWIFDTEETALSNIEYYRRPDVQYGTLPYNSTKFYEWLNQGASTPIDAVLNLYKAVQSLGIKTVFLDSKSYTVRNARAANLEKAGFTDYLFFFLKGLEYTNLSSAEFKEMVRTQLVNDGYNIVGNIGDQWSDLEGANPGARTFKFPNPLYNVH